MINILGIKFTWKMVLLGFTLAPFMTFIEKYLFSDWEFLGWVFLFVFLDTLTGVWKAIKRKDLNSKSFGGVVIKIIVFSIFLIVIHALKDFTVGGKSSGWFDWVDNAAYGTLMVREAISIFENLAIIAPNFFPVKWIDRLRGIENGKIDELASISEDANKIKNTVKDMQNKAAESNTTNKE